MGNSMGMAWWECEGMKTLYFPISHPEQAISLRRTYTIGRKTGIGEK